MVVGCEPSTVDADAGGETGLSKPVEAAIDEAIRMIDQLISEVCESQSGIAAEGEVMFGKVVKWGSLAATVYSLYYFRGDLQRYVKMKMM